MASANAGAECLIYSGPRAVVVVVEFAMPNLAGLLIDPFRIAPVAGADGIAHQALSRILTEGRAFPGAARINGTWVSISMLVCLHHSP